MHSTRNSWKNLLGNDAQRNVKPNKSTILLGDFVHTLAMMRWYEQVRNEVKWCPGQEASLAPSGSNLTSFGSKYTVLNKVFAFLLGLFGTLRSHSAPPAVIRRPHSDSAPGELCPLASLHYAPGCGRV